MRKLQRPIFNIAGNNNFQDSTSLFDTLKNQSPLNWVIEWKNWSYQYQSLAGKPDKETFGPINLQIPNGEIWAFVGPSGSGKSTLLRSVNGLIPHFYPGTMAGSITVLEKKVEITPPAVLGKQVGTVWQNPADQFFATDTTSELTFTPENYGIPANEIKLRISKAEQHFAIKDLLDRPIQQLSGGEKQTLAAAATVIADPEIFVLDEPSANLDLEGIEKLRQLCQALKKKKKTVLIAEHRLFWLQNLVDKVCYLHNQQIEKIYSANEFFQLSGKERRHLGLRTFNPPKPEQYLTTKKKVETQQLLFPSSKSNSTVRADSRVTSSCTCGLKLTDIEFAYRCRKSFKLSIPDLVLSAGQVTVFTGANGSGKSTVCRLIAGLIKPNRGKIIDCQTGSRLTSWQRQKQTFQVAQIVPNQLVYASVQAEIDSVHDGTKTQLAKTILQKLSLDKLADRHPQTLSGGQQQRLCLALAELEEKSILIFDEPTSGLDATHLHQVAQLILAQARSGKVVIVVTHDWELIDELDSTVLFFPLEEQSS